MEFTQQYAQNVIATLLDKLKIAPVQDRRHTDVVKIDKIKF